MLEDLPQTCYNNQLNLKKNHCHRHWHHFLFFRYNSISILFADLCSFFIAIRDTDVFVWLNGRYALKKLF